MSRPVDPESGYRIKIHKNKGHSYASTQPAVLDPDTGKKKYHRIHWGTVDENKSSILAADICLHRPLRGRSLSSRMTGI